MLMARALENLLTVCLSLPYIATGAGFYLRTLPENKLQPKPEIRIKVPVLQYTNCQVTR